jgi:NAD-dependent DNA ligase
LKTAKILCRYYKTLDDYFTLTQEDLEKIDGIGPIAAEHIVSFFQNPSKRELIEKLRANPRFCDLPVYAVTADTECRKDPRSSLFNDILLKPVTYDKLSAVFNRKP